MATAPCSTAIGPGPAPTAGGGSCWRRGRTAWPTAPTASAAPITSARSPSRPATPPSTAWSAGRLGTRRRPTGDARIDTCLTDLHRDEDGLSRVVLSNARAAVTVWMDESFGFLMLYTGDALDDPGRRRQGLAVEPMTCAPDAFHNGYGLVVLEPDETFRGTWGISPT